MRPAVRVQPRGTHLLYVLTAVAAAWPVPAEGRRNSSGSTVSTFLSDGHPGRQRFAVRAHRAARALRCPFGAVPSPPETVGSPAGRSRYRQVPALRAVRLGTGSASPDRSLSRTLRLPVRRARRCRASRAHAVGNTRHNVSVPDVLKSVRLRAVQLAGAHWTVTGFKAPSRHRHILREARHGREHCVTGFKAPSRHRHGVDARVVARRERADLPATLLGKQPHRPQSDDSLSPSLRLHSCCMCSICSLPVVCAACDAQQAAAFSP